MQKSDVIPLFRRHWRLASFLALLKQDTLAHITVYNPYGDGMSPPAREKYGQFCEQLKIRKRPWLVVVDHDHGGNLMKDTNGGYSPALNTIVLTRDIYEEFTQAEARGTHTVAHELGHVENLKLDRRGLLALGVLGGAVAIGTGAGALTHDIARKSAANPTVTTLAGIITAPLISIPAAHAGFNILQRGEELSADKNAAFLIGYEDCIEGIYQCIPAHSRISYEKYRPAYLERMREHCEKTGIQLSDKQLDVGFIVCMAQMKPERVISLWDIVKGNASPTNMERIRKLTPADMPGRI